jgi:SdrD B-like domain/PKD domain
MRWMWKMKKWIVPLGICTLLTFSMLTITVAAEPTVRLPTSTITMKAVNGSISWFDMTLSDVPDGFDITNGIHQGWCVEIGVNMTRNVNHQVRLYSSYDPAMPTTFRDANWNKINYVINHKQGDRKSIQQVIWWFANKDPIAPTDTDALAMRDEADANPTFVPSADQKLAILVNVVSGDTSVQRSILEFTLGSQAKLGDLVWNDVNANGIQDAGEPGLSSVTVELYNATNVKVETVNTDSSGYYSFSNVTTANYSIRFILKSGYKFTKQNIGADDTKDSDANTTTGKTPPFTYTTNDMSWDAGMFVPKPDNPDEPTPPVVKNRPPTADGTAGEPYTVLIDHEFRFDGSLSYDTDGTIVIYHWSFGDGTTANGVIVTHKYTDLGVYPVVLTVTDNKGATDTYETVARYRLPNRTPLPPTVTGPAEGHQNINYVLNIVTTDPDNDTVRYIIGWGDGTQNTSYFYTSGQNIQRSYHWKTWGFYTINVSAQDSGSPELTSNITQMMIAIDVQHAGSLGYLINTDGTGPYDAFYSNQTQNQEKAQWQQTGNYLIDTNGDGKYDQQYNPGSKTARPYPETLSPNYTMLLVGLGVVILVLLLLGYLVRRRRNKT